MDDQDVITQMLVSDDAKFDRQMVVLNLEAGRPTASTIKKLLVVEPTERKKVTPEQQATLDAAWKFRVDCKRALNDCEDNRQITALKKAYLKSVDDYKALYAKICG